MADRESYVSAQDLGWVAALGGQVDRFVEVGEIGSMFDYATTEGLMALYADGADVFCDAIDRCTNKDTSEELTMALLRRALKDGTQGAFIELALRYPDILLGRGEGESCVTVALQSLAQVRPSEAVKLAQRVLDEEPFSFGYGAHPHAFALVAAHAPKVAARWAEGREELADEDTEERWAYFAALGRTAEVRAALPKVSDGAVLVKIACSTPDRPLALDALRAHVAHRRVKLGNLDQPALLRLCELGERALVDELLERELARLEQLKPKDRDLDCRVFCRYAATVGRVDLALQACKLPTKSVRYCSVQEAVHGCATVGDFAGALAALELFDDDDHKRSAVTMSLRVTEAAFANGPRGTPFRALSTD
ncbi:MAG: hypothetical protein IPM54_34595 [Polyangiaceae bacterium]|nr:hypothetical protein [Polyangiaceae bacterium]